MSDLLLLAINAAQRCEAVYSKFISANDVGKTTHNLSKSHQYGYYISRSFLVHVFGEEVVNGRDYETFATIKWQNDFETSSRFKFYGSKNECHLTRFGKGFPFRTDDNIGDLLILCKEEPSFYNAFVLSSDEEIEDFLAALNITATDTDKVIKKETETPEGLLRKCFAGYIKGLQEDFPSTLDLSDNARRCFNTSNSVKIQEVLKRPDRILLDWLESEFQLFKEIEKSRYFERIKTPFRTVEELVKAANTILQRRKSRAGKSLEHHLAEVFRTFSLRFDTQAFTEDRKKLDFLFPGKEAYWDPKFDQNRLIALGCKTTCKDRWRQLLNEADRVKMKYLFTLQQGISGHQLAEMHKYNVRLVVPRPYLGKFPEKFREKIFCLDSFVNHVKHIQK